MGEENRVTESQLTYHMNRYKKVSVQLVIVFSVMLIFFMGIWTT